jgi:hypothetical protein
MGGGGGDHRLLLLAGGASGGCLPGHHSPKRSPMHGLRPVQPAACAASRVWARAHRRLVLGDARRRGRVLRQDGLAVAQPLLDA